jgi:carbonic anhydrase
LHQPPAAGATADPRNRGERPRGTRLGSRTPTMSHLLRAVLSSQETSMPRYAARLAELASGQAPKVMFVSCADSRVVPHAMVSMDPGELFVVRNVGNLIPPVDASGRSTGDVSEASAINYGVDVLRVREIVVCGHSGCGAMHAALTPGGPADPNLAQWLSHTDPVRGRHSSRGPNDPSLSAPDRLSQRSALQQLEHLRTYPSVRRAIELGALELHAMWFDIARARVLVYSPEARRFVPVEDALRAEALDAAPAA